MRNSLVFTLPSYFIIFLYFLYFHVQQPHQLLNRLSPTHKLCYNKQTMLSRTWVKMYLFHFLSVERECQKEENCERIFLFEKICHTDRFFTLEPFISSFFYRLKNSLNEVHSFRKEQTRSKLRVCPSYFGTMIFLLTSTLKFIFRFLWWTLKYFAIFHLCWSFRLMLLFYVLVFSLF